MLSARHNQENVTHLHQTAAAAKPLNQTVSRTPAPKTPFRNRNDENVVHTIKTGNVKGKANLFATPATTKPRAVLGAKTTNAKALQTPALGQKTTQKPPPSTQKVSPRLKRSKVRIHQPSPSADHDSDSSAPEIEYCPPPSIRTPPLPNHPEDLPLDGLFTRENFLAGVFARAAPPPDDSHARRAEQQVTANAARILDNMTFSDPYLESLRLRERRGASPPTRDARAAADALARRPDVPSFAAPTAATNARVASRATVGYAQGRQVSATKRAPLSAAHRAGVVRGTKGGARAKADDEEDRDEAFERLVREDFVLEMRTREGGYYF